MTFNSLDSVNADSFHTSDPLPVFNLDSQGHFQWCPQGLVFLCRINQNHPAHLDSGQFCLWSLIGEPFRGILECTCFSSAKQGKLEVEDGVVLRKWKSTSSKEVAVEKLFWITAMYLFPRGLVVKLTSTVFSSFLQAVMFGSQRLPVKRESNHIDEVANSSFI